VLGALPAGCHAIDLRAPDGSPVELDGTWVDQSRADAATMMWWVRTQGDCFYAAGSVDFGGLESEIFLDPSMVQVYTGTIQSDFSIDGSFLMLGPYPGFEGAPVDVRIPLKIEFTADEAGVVIREQRQPNVIGPRCQQAEYCIPPLVLEPD
jgi:hypothetical protein